MPESALRPLLFQQLEPVIALHHQTWRADTDPEAFRRYYIELLHTPWARTHVRIMGWYAGGRLVSALRVHHLEVLTRGRKRLCAGIGAVLTLPEERGKGHASAMIRAALEQFQNRFHFCLLFSTIGPRLYRRLGFFPLPSYQYVAVARKGRPTAASPGREEANSVAQSETLCSDPPPEMQARPYEPDDLPRLMEIYNLDVSMRNLGLLRTAAYWNHLFTRERAEAALLGPSGESHRTWVCLQENRVASYMTVRTLDDRLQILESPAESRRFQNWMLDYAFNLSRSEKKSRIEAQVPFHPRAEEIHVLRQRDTPLAMLAPMHSGLHPQDFPYPDESYLWSRDRF